MCTLHIAVYCVNYNSYNELYRYLDSIGKASRHIKDQAEISVFVADNTENNPKDIYYEADSFQLRIFPFRQNSGYFGAIKKMMEEVSPLPYDYSIISNVDIELQLDTFEKLLFATSGKDNAGWIAPQIFSKLENRDRNPQIKKRYSLNKLKLLRFFFHYPILHYLYTKTVYKTKKIIKHEPGKIYAGHGSFIILTKRYFESCGIIDYPVFLYDEEIYLAEMCQKHHLFVYYEPSIIVHDYEHVSTGAMNSSFYYMCNYQALQYIIKRFY